MLLAIVFRIQFIFNLSQVYNTDCLVYEHYRIDFYREESLSYKKYWNSKIDTIINSEKKEISDYIYELHTLSCIDTKCKAGILTIDKKYINTAKDILFIEKNDRCNYEDVINNFFRCKDEMAIKKEQILSKISRYTAKATVCTALLNFYIQLTNNLSFGGSVKIFIVDLKFVDQINLQELFDIALISNDFYLTMYKVIKLYVKNFSLKSLKYIKKDGQYLMDISFLTSHHYLKLLVNYVHHVLIFVLDLYVKQNVSNELIECCKLNLVKIYKNKQIFVATNPAQSILLNNYHRKVFNRSSSIIQCSQFLIRTQLKKSKENNMPVLLVLNATLRLQIIETIAFEIDYRHQTPDIENMKSLYKNFYSIYMYIFDQIMNDTIKIIFETIKFIQEFPKPNSKEKVDLGIIILYDDYDNFFANKDDFLSLFKFDVNGINDMMEIIQKLGYYLEMLLIKSIITKIESFNLSNVNVDTMDSRDFFAFDESNYDTYVRSFLTNANYKNNYIEKLHKKLETYSYLKPGCTSSFITCDDDDKLEQLDYIPKIFQNDNSLNALFDSNLQSVIKQQNFIEEGTKKFLKSCESFFEDYNLLDKINKYDVGNDKLNKRTCENFTSDNKIYDEKLKTIHNTQAGQIDSICKAYHGIAHKHTKNIDKQTKTDLRYEKMKLNRRLHGVNRGRGNEIIVKFISKTPSELNSEFNENCEDTEALEVDNIKNKRKNKNKNQSKLEVKKKKKNAMAKPILKKTPQETIKNDNETIGTSKTDLTKVKTESEIYSSDIPIHIEYNVKKANSLLINSEENAENLSAIKSTDNNHIENNDSKEEKDLESTDARQNAETKKQQQLFASKDHKEKDKNSEEPFNDVQKNVAENDFLKQILYENTFNQNLRKECSTKLKNSHNKKHEMSQLSSINFEISKKGKVGKLRFNSEKANKKCLDDASSANECRVDLLSSDNIETKERLSNNKPINSKTINNDKKKLNKSIENNFTHCRVEMNAEEAAQENEDTIYNHMNNERLGDELNAHDSESAGFVLVLSKASLRKNKQAQNLPNNINSKNDNKTDMPDLVSSPSNSQKENIIEEAEDMILNNGVNTSAKNMQSDNHLTFDRDEIIIINTDKEITKNSDLDAANNVSDHKSKINKSNEYQQTIRKGSEIKIENSSDTECQLSNKMPENYEKPILKTKSEQDILQTCKNLITKNMVQSQNIAIDELNKLGKKISDRKDQDNLVQGNNETTNEIYLQFDVNLSKSYKIKLSVPNFMQSNDQSNRIHFVVACCDSEKNKETHEFSDQNNKKSRKYFFESVLSNENPLLKNNEYTFFADSIESEQNIAKNKKTKITNSNQTREEKDALNPFIQSKKNVKPSDQIFEQNIIEDPNVKNNLQKVVKKSTTENESKKKTNDSKKINNFTKKHFNQRKNQSLMINQNKQISYLIPEKSEKIDFDAKKTHSTSHKNKHINYVPYNNIGYHNDNYNDVKNMNYLGENNYKHNHQLHKQYLQKNYKNYEEQHYATINDNNAIISNANQTIYDPININNNQQGSLICLNMCHSYKMYYDYDKQQNYKFYENFAQKINHSLVVYVPYELHEALKRGEYAIDCSNQGYVLFQPVQAILN